MQELNLAMICFSSFVAVFSVLIGIAVVMRGLIAVFPYQEAETDGAVIAAIHSAYSVTHPGTRISKIQEINRKEKKG